MKFQDAISFPNITVAKFQYPKFTKIHMNFSQDILLIISFQLTQVSSFNTFRVTAFTKFHPLFFKGP